MSASAGCISCGSPRLQAQLSILHCTDCGLRFAAQGDTLDYARAYTEDAEVYPGHFRVLERMQTLRNLDRQLLPFERIIRDEVRSRGDVRSFMDLGCGIGRFLRALRLSGLIAAGYELAAPVVERLRAHGLDVTCGSVEAFLGNARQADAISLLEVVEHLPHPGPLIERLLQQKKPRLLFVVVPDSDTRRQYDRNFAEHDQPPNHLSWWTVPALHALLARPGYRVRVQAVPEKRRSLVGHFLRNPQRYSVSALMLLVRGLVRPPAFWFLGVAERQDTAPDMGAGHAH